MIWPYQLPWHENLIRQLAKMQVDCDNYGRPRRTTTTKGGYFATESKLRSSDYYTSTHASQNYTTDRQPVGSVRVRSDPERRAAARGRGSAAAKYSWPHER